jgi:lauroyl/myristoyl acyltransferase
MTVHARRVPFVRLQDVVRGGALVAIAPVAWLVPPRYWRGLTRALVAPLARVRERGPDAWSATVARTFGARAVPVRPSAIRGRVTAQFVEALFQVLRSYRIGGWKPVVRLEGRERLTEALARHQGCVLWVHRFRPMIHFLALHDAGVPVWRPSDEGHGYFHRSWIGRRWLNPVQLRIERRYSHRIVADDAGFGHLRRLRERLRANAVINLYCDSIPGGRNVDVPFLDGRLGFGTQAPSLALDAGAPLLPVFPLCEAPNVFRVVIDAPIALDVSAGRARALESAVRQLAAGLEPYVERHPDQWHDWWRVQRR